MLLFNSFLIIYKSCNVLKLQNHDTSTTVLIEACVINKHLWFIYSLSNNLVIASWFLCLSRNTNQSRPKLGSVDYFPFLPVHLPLHFQMVQQFPLHICSWHTSDLWTDGKHPLDNIYRAFTKPLFQPGYRWSADVYCRGH